jgi:GNAT superfamily N-acetyltransferase
MKSSHPPLLSRDAKTADLEAVVRLHHYVRQTCLPYLPVLHTIDDGLVFFSEVFRGCTVLVAERRGEIIGYCAYRGGWIDHLYVHPEHQGQGIGSTLLKRAMQVEDALRLWTFQKNAQARTFYERHGFRLVRTTDGSGNEEHQPDALYEWVASP